MTKKVMGEDGKMYVVKKPFYKKVWFWILIAIVLVGVGSSLGGDSEKVTKIESKPTESSKTESKELEKEFKIGDTVSYKGYEIRVNSMDISPGDEVIKPDEGKEFVIVDVTITNNTDDKQTYNPFDYSLNANGNSTSMTSYLPDVDTLRSGTLDPGATVSGKLIGTAEPGTELKLQYKSNFWNDETVDIQLN